MASLLFAASCVVSPESDGEESLSVDESEVFKSGTEGADSLTGTPAADVIIGLGGNDQISGGDGPDQLHGGDGNDQLDGDAGDDTLIGGPGGNILRGGAGRDNLFGGPDGDRLEGGPGADTMTGGTGNDVYIYDGTDTIVEEANGGADLVRSTVSLAVPQNCEGIALEGTANLNATGDHNNNTLMGNSGDNRLVGNGGSDTLGGGDGNDLLDGGPGSDTLNGGNGDDTYLYGLDDRVDTITDGRGADRVQFKSGIQPSDVTFEVPDDESMTVRVKGAKAIRILCPPGAGGPMRLFRFDDGSQLPDRAIPVHCQR